MILKIAALGDRTMGIGVAAAKTRTLVKRRAATGQCGTNGTTRLNTCRWGKSLALIILAASFLNKRADLRGNVKLELHHAQRLAVYQGTGQAAAQPGAGACPAAKRTNSIRLTAAADLYPQRIILRKVAV